MADFSRDQLQAMAGNAADKYNVPRDLFMALITQESDWNPHVVSSRGAQGLGQLMPGTAANLGVSHPFDPAQNLDGSARLLGHLIKTFGSEDNALAAYNAGPGAVQQYGGIPPYRETMDYVARIQHYLRPHYSGAGMGPTPAAPPAIPGLGAMLSGGASAPKAAPIPGLDAMLAAPAAPRPAPAPKVAPIPGLSAMLTGAPKATTTAPVIPGLDAMLSGAPAAAPPLFANARSTPAAPGALSMPPGAAPLPGAVAPAGAALQAKQDVQAQENLGLPQKALNIVNTPISVASAFGNQLAKEIGKTHEAGGVQQGRVDAGVIFPELVKAIRNTPWAKTFVQGIKGESSQFPELLRSIGEGAPTSAAGKFTQQHPAVTTGLDFALSFPLLAATDSLQNEAVGLVGRGASALNRATGAGDKIISSIPGLQSMLQNGQTENALREVMGKNIAGFDHIYRDGAEAAEDARQTSQKYLHGGQVTMAYQSPHTGQPVNIFDEFVADRGNIGAKGNPYEDLTPPPHQVAADSATVDQMHGILTRAKGAVPRIVQAGPEGLAWSKAAADLRAELGTPYAIPAETGAGKTLSGVLDRARETGPEVIRANAYNDLGTAAQRAQKNISDAAELERLHADIRAHGIDPADVDRVAGKYSRIFDNLGQHFVDMGMMKPEAYQALKGSFLPRLYLMTKGNPGDVDAFLKFLGSEGALTPDAVAEAQKRGLAKTWQAGVGAKQLTQSRELTDFGARNDADFARAMVPEATPAALHGIEAQTRAAGIASGMREIAQNPEWALPRESMTLAHRQAGWADFPGKGPLQGMAVHPALLHVLEEAKRPNVNRAVMHALLGPKLGEHVYHGNQVIRKAMLAGPSTIANVGVGHYYFAAAKAVEEGTHFTPLDYALAARDMRTAAKGGRVDPYLHEAMNQTDLLSRGAGILPKEAKRVSGGVGLETPLQNVGRSLKAAGAKYLGATHDILAAGKFGLYRQLRKAGKSVDEAARLTRVATINYQGLPAAIRKIDNGMVAPFITFTYRAAPLAGRIAARSPGLFSLATGNRLNWYLDRMADRLDQARGLPGGAVALRQAGGVGPTTFALPGRHNAQGQQQYAQAPLLAPLLHHFGAGVSITEPIVRQIRGLAPVLSTIWQLSLGLDLRGDQPRPIVPAGLPPGSTAEAAGENVKWIMHALVPPIAGLDRIKNAAQGTTAYAQSGLKPQTTGEAALQFLTGTRLGTAPALLPSRQTPPALSGAFTQARSDAALAEEKRSGGAVAGQAAMDRLSALFDKGSKDPDFVPNKGLADYAAKLSNPALRDALAAAKDRLPNVAFGEHYTGSDKVTETNRQIDFTYVLLHEADNPARNLHVKIRDELFPFNRTLGAVQSP